MNQPLIPHHQPPEMPQPPDRALDDPAQTRRGQIRRPSPSAMPAATRNARPHPPGAQVLPAGLAVSPLVSHQYPRTAPGPSAGTRHTYGGQRGGCQPDCRWLGPGHVPSAGHPGAIGYQHHVAALPALSHAHRFTPCLAGMTVPSQQARAHSRLPWASRGAHRGRQIRSQPPASCHWRSRRQPVTGLPDRRGRSPHRQPVRSTYTMPLRVLRSSARGRPRVFGGGSNGRITSQWVSGRSRPLVSLLSDKTDKSLPHLKGFLKWVLEIV